MTAEHVGDPDEERAGPEEVEDPLGPPGEDEGGDVGPAEEAVADAGGDDPEPDGQPATGDVETLIADLERTAQERDGYLDQLRRNQAEFENARKRLTKQAADAADRATEQLAEKLLPVLDACDAALAHGAPDVEPVFAALLGTLEKEGLERIDPAGEAFDPNRHEAVLHEPAGSDDEAEAGTVVADVLRTGYAWKDRVVRPAMVKVRG